MVDIAVTPLTGQGESFGVIPLVKCAGSHAASSFFVEIFRNASIMRSMFALSEGSPGLRAYQLTMHCSARPAGHESKCCSMPGFSAHAESNDPCHGAPFTGI